jgi:hypothetical protein
MILLFEAAPTLAGTVKMQCMNGSTFWGTLTIDAADNIVGMTLADRTSVGPGNYSGSGNYAAKIDSAHASWTLPFSATHYDYDLNLQTGLLRQRVFVNEGGVLTADSATISCK